ncbi:MAG: hypothetical protein D6717_09345 [Gammaproteobacteria bacterium]|nr:MAG: hypothetical protein D6717_09345 [Gammaproteobacteria bacterium]
MLPGGVAKVPDLQLEPGDCLLVIADEPGRARRLSRCLAGLEPPESGHIELAATGAPLPATWLEPGIEPLASLSVRENLLLPAWHHGLPAAHVEERLALLYPDDRLLADDRLLPERLDAMEQRRLVLARALLLGPVLLSLHHPLAGLPARQRLALADWLRGCARQLGTVLLMSLEEPLLGAHIPAPLLLIDTHDSALFEHWQALLDSPLPAAQDIRQELSRLCSPLREKKTRP